MGVQVFSPVLVMNSGSVRVLDELTPAAFEEGTKATRVRVVAGARDNKAQALASTWLTCRKGGPIHDGVACLGCSRFVDCLLREGRADIRCRWSGTDVVEEIMTDVAALICVSPDARCEEALELAWSRHVHNLVVADGQLGLGIANDFDLLVGARDKATVRDVLLTGVPAVAPETTLAEAVTAFATTHCGLLLVIERNRLLGLLSATDLINCGADALELGGERCVCCGTISDVHAHPEMEWVMICADCLALSLSPPDYNELGVGD
jgi:hypothetical protein